MKLKQEAMRTSRSLQGLSSTLRDNRWHSSSSLRSSRWDHHRLTSVNSDSELHRPVRRPSPEKTSFRNNRSNATWDNTKNIRTSIHSAQQHCRQQRTTSVGTRSITRAFLDATADVRRAASGIAQNSSSSSMSKSTSSSLQNAILVVSLSDACITNAGSHAVKSKGIMSLQQNTQELDETSTSKTARNRTQASSTTSSLRTALGSLAPTIDKKKHKIPSSSISNRKNLETGTATQSTRRHQHLMSLMPKTNFSCEMSPNNTPGKLSISIFCCGRFKFLDLTLLLSLGSLV